MHLHSFGRHGGCELLLAGLAVTEEELKNLGLEPGTIIPVDEAALIRAHEDNYRMALKDLELMRRLLHSAQREIRKLRSELEGRKRS